MSKGFPESWARDGAEQDIRNLLRICEQLTDSGRKALFDEAVEAVATRVFSGRKQAKDGEELRADDWFEWIATENLMYLGGLGSLLRRLYELGSKRAGDKIGSAVDLVELHVHSQDGEVLTAAIYALGRQKVPSSLGTLGIDESAHLWLAQIADETFWLERQQHHHIDRLIGFACDRYSPWKDCFFSGGFLEFAIAASPKDYLLGDALFRSYMDIRCRTDSELDMPHPKEVLGVAVDELEYSEFWEDDGWVLKKEEYEQEVNHRCIVHFASFVGAWRGRFMDAILAFA